MKIYWLSWVQRTEDPRPLTYPPNEKVMGWWCSGSDSEDWPIICAYVQVEDEEKAIETIKKDWPEFDGDWRLFQEREEFTNSRRFPLNDWMKLRMKKWKDI